MGKRDEGNRIFNFPCTDLWLCPFLQLDDGDGVRIGFVEADGEGSAAIACVVMTAFDVLRAMDVSECQVVVPFSHSAEGNILYSADTLIVPATVAAFNREMGHEDDGKLCRIPFLHFVQQCLEEACLPLVARCFSVQQGEVLRIDVGHGNDVAYCLFSLFISMMCLSKFTSSAVRSMFPTTFKPKCCQRLLSISNLELLSWFPAVTTMVISGQAW